MLDKLREADQINWSRAVVDSASARAVFVGGERTAPNRTDRRKSGSRPHVITDAQGVPLVARLTGANRHDVTQLLPLVDAIPPIRGKVGRPRCKPDRLYADRAYDSHMHRMLPWVRGVEPMIAKHNTEHGTGLGRVRWVVDRTVSWLHQFRRLRVRYERHDDIHDGFLSLGCAMICLSALEHGFCQALR